MGDIKFERRLIKEFFDKLDRDRFLPPTEDEEKHPYLSVNEVEELGSLLSDISSAFIKLEKIGITIGSDLLHIFNPQEVESFLKELDGIFDELTIIKEDIENKLSGRE